MELEYLENRLSNAELKVNKIRKDRGIHASCSFLDVAYNLRLRGDVARQLIKQAPDKKDEILRDLNEETILEDLNYFDRYIALIEKFPNYRLVEMTFIDTQASYPFLKGIKETKAKELGYNSRIQAYVGESEKRLNGLGWQLTAGE